jgi:putative transposase
VAAPTLVLVADFTYVKFSTGLFVYVEFVTDAYAGAIVNREATGCRHTRFRRISNPPGRRAASSTGLSHQVRDPSSGCWIAIHQRGIR